MNTESQREKLRWKKQPFPELARLAWPIAVSMLSFSTMTLVDTLFVSRLGVPELAGVGLGGVAAFTLMCFGFGLLRAVKVNVSQALGAGREGGIPGVIGAGLVLAVGLGALTIVGGVLGAEWVGSLAQTAETGSVASEYLTIRVFSAPLFLVAVALREARYGLGDSRSPMFASVIANVANIGLDYSLIFVFGLGIQGAAWATVCAVVLEAALLIGLHWRAKTGFGLGQVRLANLSAVSWLGLPLGLQMLLEVGSFALLTGLIATMGELELAAHQIALQLLHFGFLPALAIGEAASVMVGQAVGANEDGLVRRVGRQTLLLVTAYTGLGALVLATIPELLARGFTSDPGLSSRVVALLGVAAAFQIFDGANIVARCVLRGTGDVNVPAALNVSMAWLIAPPLAWFCGVHLGLGSYGAWLGLCAEITFGAAVLWWRLERGHWAPAALRSRAELASLAPVSTPQAAE